MKDNEQHVRDLVAEQAAEWFVENRAGLNTTLRREFSAWLKVSPVHVEEYLALAALTHDLAAASRPGGESAEDVVARALAEGDSTVHHLPPRAAAGHPQARRPARWRGLAMAASVLLGIGMLSTWQYLRSGRAPAEQVATLHFNTRHGEQQTYRLADQSVLHLNTDSAVTVRFSERERLVVLEAGQADFEVAHEAARAFRVTAGSARVLAVGTQFDVHLSPAATVVTVSEGRVKVALATDEGLRNYQPVGAGEQMQVSPDAWPARAVAVDVGRTTSWLQGKARFDDQPLSQVMEELNRYAAVPYEITSPSLRNVQVSGVFATDDPDAFTAFLRSLKDVRVKVTDSRILVSKP